MANENLIQIVRAERQGILLRLLCFRKKDLQAVDSVMSRLASRLETLPAPLYETEIIDKTVAVFTDDRWMRGTYGKNSVVNLFDIGVQKIVPLKQIRVGLAEMQMPQITFWCCLQNFFANCGKTQIEEAVQGMDAEIASERKVKRSLLVNLRIISGPLEEMLEHLGHGTVVDPLEFIEYYKLEAVYDGIISHLRQHGVVDISSKNLGPDVLTATRMLPNNVLLAAKVVSVTKGPKQFLVQLEQQKSLANIIGRMFEVTRPLELIPKADDACMIQLGDSTNVARALVVSCDGLTANVVLLDVDMSEVEVDMRSLREMPEILKKIPPQVSPVSLVDADQFTEAGVEAFKKVVLGNDLELIAFEGDRDTLQKCKLTVDGESVFDLMTEMVICKAYKRETLCVGNKYLVRLTRIKPRNEAWSFYIQLAIRKQELVDLNERINKHCELRSAVSHQFFIGDPVFAKCQSGLWKRAVVLKKKTSSTEVLFVDDGVEAEVFELRAACPTLVDGLSAQGIECFYAGCDIDFKNASALQAMIGTKHNFMEVVESLESGQYKVILLNTLTHPPSDILASQHPLQQPPFIRRNSLSSVASVSVASSICHELGPFEQPPETTEKYLPIVRSPMPSNIEPHRAISVMSNYSDDQFNVTSTSNVSHTSASLKEEPLHLSAGETVKRRSSETMSSYSSQMNFDHGNDMHTPAKKSQIEDLSFSEPARYTDMIVHPSSKFNAMLSWMINPSRFYVQPACFSKQLDELMALIEKFKPDEMPCLRSIKSGDPCLAKFDGAWYRAKVLHVSGDSADVFFVDYGNITTVSIAHGVRGINMQLIEMQAHAVLCSLKGVGMKTYWTERETDKLNDIICEGVMMVEVVGIWNDTFSVIITKNDKNINLALGASKESLQPLAYIPEMKPFERQRAVVSWFTSPSNFFIQPQDFQNRLAILTKQLSLCFKGCTLTKKFVQIGSLVLAPIGGKDFARGEVSDIKDSKARVFLVDYGQFIVSPIESLHPLPDQLRAIEKHALHCSLYDLKPFPNEDWPKAGQCPAIDKLFKKTDLEYFIRSRDNDGLAMVKLKWQDVDFRDLLEIEGVAKRIGMEESLPVQNVNLKHYFMSNLSNLPFVNVHNEDNVMTIRKISQKITPTDLHAPEACHTGDMCAIEYAFEGTAPTWHRAKRLSDGTYLMIDFGISVQGRFPNRKLPDSVMAIPAQTIRACFPVIPKKGNVDFDVEDAKQLERLICLGQPKKFFCREIGLSNGILFLHPQILNDTRDSYVDMKKQNINCMQFTSRKVVVSHFASSKCVYLVEDIDKLHWMEDRLIVEPKTLLKGPFSVGQICAAPFGDSIYRARVLPNNKVVFIDYGNEEDIRHKLWKLSPDVELVSPLAKCFCMRGANNLLPEVEIALENLLLNDEEFDAVNVSENEVVLFKNGKDVLEVAQLETELELLKSTADDPGFEESVTDENLQGLQETLSQEIAHDKTPPTEGSIGGEDQVKTITEAGGAVHSGLNMKDVEPKKPENEDPESVEGFKTELLEEPENVQKISEPDILISQKCEVEADEKTEIESSVKDGQQESNTRGDADRAEVPGTVDEVPLDDAEEKTEIKLSVKEEAAEDEVLKKVDVEHSDEKNRREIPDMDFQKFFISAVKSPKEIYLLSDMEAVPKLSRELSCQPDFPSQELAIDELCAALSEDDGLWGRAQIISLRPPTGFFLDTGKVSQIIKFKTLNDSHLEMEPFAIKCALREDQPSDALKEGTWIKVRVKDGLAEFRSTRRQAVVAHYESHCELYLRPVEDDLSAMESQLGLGSPVNVVQEGSLYAAQNDVGDWCRARVNAIDGAVCHVFFLDHGVYGQASNLKNLFPKWHQRPEAARLCFLKPVPPPEARPKIKQLLKSGLVVEVDGLGSGDRAHEVSIYLEGQNVIDFKIDPGLRPDAKAFVPTRNWMTVGRKVVSTFVKEARAGDVWEEAAKAMGNLLKQAEDEENLSEKGLAVLEEAFQDHRSGSTPLLNTPAESPDEQEVASDLKSPLPKLDSAQKSNHFAFSPTMFYFKGKKVSFKDTEQDGNPR
ncbi:uncharacterized protein LOC132202657 isoform X2 [Neocloeon triangulifer]|uniref:uncharacterized protein LOC132202657 isoform X2 n=1 Tax=Neocloeon triangulifer TaxID=2078957 RepID=UPI00286F8CBE|nr:uncharacterized protein LOC132202657 isoform X2 [Neocloeon triangulifer]